MAPQTKMPRIGTKGTNGVLNCLCISGFFTLSIHIPAHTSMNANKVPMLVISPTISPGTNAAKDPTNKKNIQFDLYGVLCFGCTSEKTLGTNPSRLME